MSFSAVRAFAAIKIVVAVDVLVFFTSLMAYILRRCLTCMCWAQKFGILIFACFCFLLVVLCFPGPCCSCSVSTVNFCWILFLYFYSANWFYFARHMAEAETRKKCECHSSSKAVPRTIFTSHTLIFRSAWVGVWLRFVYVHLSGFNVRSSVKSTARKKRFTFQRLVSAVSCLCFTVMCGFSFLNMRGLVFINSHKARPFSKRYFFLFNFLWIFSAYFEVNTFKWDSVYFILSSYEQS